MEKKLYAVKVLAKKDGEKDIPLIIHVKTFEATNAMLEALNEAKIRTHGDKKFEGYRFTVRNENCVEVKGGCR